MSVKQGKAKQQSPIDVLVFEGHEGVMVTDKNKVLLRVNQAFTRLTGYSAKEAVGQTPSILSSGLHDKKFYRALWKSIAEDGYWQGEIWNRRKSGELFAEWLTITAITGADGQVTNYVGTFSDITLQKQAEKVMHETRKFLEKQVHKTTAELRQLHEEFDEVSTTLKVLLKHHGTDQSKAQIELADKLRQEVTPFLQKLRKSRLELKQIRLLATLEGNLQHLVTSYGHTTTASAAYHQLTPNEIQVASMVRQGLPTKVIAATLSLSPETINVHRKHIRKKLGLAGKSTNLRSFLMMLTD